VPLQPELIREGERLMTICNACRYCEGYCAVFPAMEKRTQFLKADLNYLANLCHNCQECFYACPFTPPHAFAMNVPRTLAQIRVASYQQYAWPKWYRRSASRLGWIIIFASVGLSVFLPDSSDGNFYRVIPHYLMVAVFLAISLFTALVFLVGAARFWRETERWNRVRGLAVIGRSFAALRDVFTLRNFRRGPRRFFHHLTFYGFLLCFASTVVAAVYHYYFRLRAPYPFASAPVVLGTLGGVGLVLGPVGLLAAKKWQDRAPSNPAQRRLDAEFIVLLLLTSITGLVLLAFRDSKYLATLMALHLGCVAALFITMPYGKFVHGLYRALALFRYSAEQRTEDKTAQP
jgi:citrate/tricarballylate utilization protein